MPNHQETQTLIKPIKLEYVHEGADCSLVDLLADKTSLSKVKIKKALNFGCCWLKKNNQGKLLRQRRADYQLKKGDLIKLFYDEKILNIPEVKSATNIFKNSNFGIWVKEEGVLSQGSEFGDHASLERFLQKTMKNLFLVHRLDRETRGLILFALNKNAARFFSEMWQKNLVEKIYRAKILGHPKEDHFFIEKDLDGKKAKSEIFVVERKADTTIVDIKLHTGRFHQIRRHLESIAHPIMGDPLYGKNNKGEKLQLESYKLSFIDPFDKKQKVFQIPTNIS
jgi:tRNA pseudouridine32 synthase/23S rRNA pseudouridine746 synthase